MTPIDFFSDQYLTEAPRTDTVFGIIDDGIRAFTTINDPTQWMATVSNSNNLALQFVPVDHNITVTGADGNEQSMCDGMLHDTKQWISFVELKDRSNDWISKAISQLLSTIDTFCKYHNPGLFQHRRAYACNRQRPRFASSHKSAMQHFYNQTGFRLIIGGEIKVK